MPLENKTGILELIRTRRSVRKYNKHVIPDTSIEEILEAGRWAPSGLNNQPWRFVVIKDRAFIDRISGMTRYSEIIKGASFCIAVFYNSDSGYHREKDIMSIGAAIQNMLLYSHSIGIGTVWLGEILKNGDKICELLEVSRSNEFMALIAFGYPDESPDGKRLKIDEILLKTI